MDKGSIIRTVLLVIALVNQVLTSSGYTPLPFDDQTVNDLISLGFTIVTSVVAWWKNNYITKKGQKQKKVIDYHGL